MSVVRIATRGSELALAQSGHIARRIERELGMETELQVITTSGDRLQDVPLARIGGKGLFVKEIEEALLSGEADLAIHSAKDLPAVTPPGLVLACFPEREDPRDALVGRLPGATLDDLEPGARVGTGSARRTALLRAARPDIEIVPLRGNVTTRLRKLVDARLDAVVLAHAGLARLGMADRIHESIAPERVLPAVGQGVLALETRADGPLAKQIARLEDPEAAIAIRAERAFLVRLEGDCTVPLAAYAEVEADGGVWLRGLVAGMDGIQVARAEARGFAVEAEALGRRVAEAVLADGGEEILATQRGMDLE